MQNPVENIVETLQDRLDCTSFLEITNGTNFWEILSGEGPFTVFVPDDRAFLELPDDAFNDLIKSKNALRLIASNHVVSGRFHAEEIGQMDAIETMANQSIAIERNNEGVLIGAAKVVEGDIICTNGIVHIIDVVLMP